MWRNKDNCFYNLSSFPGNCSIVIKCTVTTLSKERVLPWYFTKASTFWSGITYFSISPRNLNCTLEWSAGYKHFDVLTWMNEVFDWKTEFIKWSLFWLFMIAVSKLITEDLQAKTKTPLLISSCGTCQWCRMGRLREFLNQNFYKSLISAYLFSAGKQPLHVWCSRSEGLCLWRLIIERGRLPGRTAG